MQGSDFHFFHIWKFGTSHKAHTNGKLCFLHTLQLDGGKRGSWLKDIQRSLQDILSSKLDAARREAALGLSAVLSQTFGLEWAMETQDSTKFLMLWLRLVVVVSE